MKAITRCAAIIATAAITLAAGAAEARDRFIWGYGLPEPIPNGPPIYYAPPPVYGAPPVYGQPIYTPPVYQQVGPGVYSPYPQQGYYGRVTFQMCKQQLALDQQAWERDRQANGGTPLGPRPNHLRCADYPLN